ncbi:MAG: trypsin-like peptidase domain-containing protein [Planctomycetia bacterium]|nr:trypsin-like peptidase domain-containing protein [Planctomycetia bacterium]
MSFSLIFLLAVAGSMDVSRQVAELTPSLVCIFPADGTGGGSGVVISEDGLVLTNFHVAQPCGAWMKCGMADGSVVHAVLVGLDPVGDVALIRLLPGDAKKKFVPVRMGDSDRLRAGDEVLVLGNPFLFAEDFTPTVSTGILSGVHRYQFPAGTLLEYADCLQTDAAINPGNSGGPLFNRAGELIGINGRCSFEKRGRINVGVGYAISINQIRKFLSHLAAGRIVDHATLGATVTADDLGRPVVDEILETCDAALRGLEPGDRITRLGNRPVRTPNDFKNVLGTFPKGWVVPLEFVRRQGAGVMEEHRIVVRLEGVHNDTELAGLLAQDFDKDEKTPKKPEQEPSGEEKIRKELFAHLNDLPADVKPFYVKRDGWANDHFNQVEKQRIWTRLASSQRGKKEFHGTGKTSSGATFTLDITPDKTFLRLPDGENFWANTGDFTKAADPPSSGLILPGLTLWAHLQQADLAGWKALDVWGAGGEEGKYDTLFGNVGGLDVRVYFTRTTPSQLAMLELAAYDGGFPWEFLFEPGKITIRRGTTILETLTYETPEETENAATPPPATPPVVENATQDVPCPQAFDKILKIYGAGGFAGLEDYQSGCFISSDGLVLTAFAPSLDTDDLRCVTQDGTRYAAKLVGTDPVLEIALLKIDAEGTPCFDLKKPVEAPRSGTPVYAFSNLFNVAVGNEPVSVQRGHVGGTLAMDATHGVYPSRYRGEVYLLDVTTNNPGAAGGALVSESGEFLGMLGKELQHAQTGEWLNYAIPVSVLASAVQAIQEGKASPDFATKKKPERAWTMEKLGIRFVPEVMEKTPPYVDCVRDGSPFLPDDLMLYVNDKLVSSIADVREMLESIDVADPIWFSVLRDGNIVEVEVKPE